MANYEYPARQGPELRAYRMGYRSGLRGTHKPAARARWENRWAGQPESHYWLTWSEGYDAGAWAVRA